YRRRLDAALRLFMGDSDARARLIGHVEQQMRAAAAQRQYERAGWLRRRARRLEVILDRLGGVLEATHSRPRLLLAAHPVAPRFDAVWLVAGRLLDWGPAPDQLEELDRRRCAALTRGGRGG